MKVQNLVRMLVTVMVLAALVGGLSARAHAVDAGSREKRVTCVMVQSGDTLWGIAKQYYTKECGSFSDYVKELQRSNGLYDETIRAGETIIVPYYVSGEKVGNVK